MLAASLTGGAARAQETPPWAEGLAAGAPLDPLPEGAVSAGLPEQVMDQDPPLPALVEEALARNPDVLAAVESVTAARARPAQVRSLPDPMLSLQYTNDAWRLTLGDREMTTLALVGSQTLPWPGKRRLRTALSAQGIVRAEERLARVRLAVTAAVSRAYWGLVLARETSAILDEQNALWRQAEDAARARYGVGAGSIQDVLRAQIEITRTEQRRTVQQAEFDIRAAELNRLLGRDADAPTPRTAPLRLRTQATDADALVALAEARSPELRTVVAEAERERLGVQLTRKEFRPDLTLQAGYMNRGGLEAMWQAGVAVDLPVARGRRQAALAEAEARERFAARTIESVRAELRYRTQERAAQLRGAEALTRLYVEGTIPQTRLAYEAAIASYQAGRAPFLAVLEALSSLYANRAGYLRVLAAHERIKVAIEEASLEPTSEMPETDGSAGSMAGSFAVSAVEGAGATLASPSADGAADMLPMGR